MQAQGLKYLAGAIAFAVIVFSVMFRYEYQQAGTVRLNRWTGERQEICQLAGGDWIWTVDCFAAQSGR
ncbi:hypothetical protein [Ralstonia pseudosolanacearum]|uniref:hypothetical protein n=1 Tax=Ralstonia pseudosolanacearum TaxID=1310165 RepID=UPI0011CDF17D|nr:hypothetical protein [Ralstonia pseudosolanacearum]